jgi:hypothetical protein
VLYDYVPGFNGVRVPARYAMIAGLFLAVLSGFGVRRILAGASSAAPKAIIGAVVGALILLEGAAVPMEINRAWKQDEAMPPARVYPAGAAHSDRSGEGVPPVYARLASFPDSTVVTEFPFGDGAWEIRYVSDSTVHWKRITNGYSGGFPPDYKARVARLRLISRDPEGAWQSLHDSGSTHVVVHRNAFANPADADTVERWLSAHGAEEVQRFPDNDILFALRF